MWPRALELERPFLGPLYGFMALQPRQSTRRVPACVGFILQYLADHVAQTRHYDCSETRESTTEAPRVDAQASGHGDWDRRMVPETQQQWIY